MGRPLAFGGPSSPALVARAFVAQFSGPSNRFVPNRTRRAELGAIIVLVISGMFERRRRAV